MSIFYTFPPSSLYPPPSHFYPYDEDLKSEPANNNLSPSDPYSLELDVTSELSEEGNSERTGGVVSRDCSQYPRCVSFGCVTWHAC